MPFLLKFPLILVGNKCDDLENRIVSKEDGEQLAMQFNSTFCESSAKENINVLSVLYFPTDKSKFSTSIDF